MAVDIDTLLALPQKERRKIAEQLWHSLSPSTSVSKEDEDVIALLDKRWEWIKGGKSKLYSPEQIRQMTSAYYDQPKPPARKSF